MNLSFRTAKSRPNGLARTFESHHPDAAAPAAGGTLSQVMRHLGPDAADMVRADHTRVLALFHRYKQSADARQRRSLAELICTALEIHAQVEEELLYPALQAIGADRATLAKSVPQHDEMRSEIARLRHLSAEDPRFDTTFLRLMREVIHHVADEETILLPQAEAGLGEDLQTLGARMNARRIALHAPAIGRVAWSALGALRTLPLGTVAGVGLAAAALFWLARGRRSTRPSRESFDTSTA